MCHAKAKTTLVFDYVAQTGPDPLAESRTKKGLVPPLSSGHIVGVLCPHGQQHPGTTGPDQAHHLDRGRGWSWPLANSLSLEPTFLQ